MPPANFYDNKICGKVNFNPGRELIVDGQKLGKTSKNIADPPMADSSIGGQAVQILFDLLGAEAIRVQVDKALEGRSRLG